MPAVLKKPLIRVACGSSPLDFQKICDTRANQAMNAGGKLLVCFMV